MDPTATTINNVNHAYLTDIWSRKVIASFVTQSLSIVSTATRIIAVIAKLDSTLMAKDSVQIVLIT
jgi:hypothetical protein